MEISLPQASIEKRQTSEDAETFAAISAATFTQTFGHLYKPEDLNAFLTEKHSAAIYRRLLADERYGLWLARSAEGAVIGYAVAGPCDLPVPEMPANAGELMRLYLLKDHQGDGLGRRMLETALDWLEPRYDQLFLSVYAENFGAQRLYKRYGFEKVAEYDYMVGNHADPEFIFMRVMTTGQRFDFRN
ncbi:MAG: GNAT family N-acetyltransferase [Hyphococcus sp.]